MLGFLHTADSNRSLFSGLLARVAPGTAAAHRVAPELLALARDGMPPAQLAPRVRDALAALVSSGARVTCCTCSSLGALAEAAELPFDTPSLRVDRAMAEAALATGPRLVVVAALESALPPVEALLRDSAARSGADLETTLLLCPEAWPRFEAGDAIGYAQTIARAIERHPGGRVDAFVLAQASMFDVPGLVRCEAPVFSSCESGIRAALRALEERPAGGTP